MFLALKSMWGKPTTQCVGTTLCLHSDSYGQLLVTWQGQNTLHSKQHTQLLQLSPAAYTQVTLQSASPSLPRKESMLCSEDAA